jgi:hypothetical protein
MRQSVSVQVWLFAQMPPADKAEAMAVDIRLPAAALQYRAPALHLTVAVTLYLLFVADYECVDFHVCSDTQDQI